MESELSRLTADVADLSDRVGSLEGKFTSLEKRVDENASAAAEALSSFRSETMASLDQLRNDLVASNRVHVSLFARFGSWIAALARRSASR